MKKKRIFEREFSTFVDDLGGFLWAMKAARKATWETLASEVNLSATTLLNLANRVTQSPQLYTCWRILRGLDNTSIIRHSQLEKYRGIAGPKKKKAA